MKTFITTILLAGVIVELIVLGKKIFSKKGD